MCGGVKYLSVCSISQIFQMSMGSNAVLISRLKCGPPDWLCPGSEWGSVFSRGLGSSRISGPAALQREDRGKKLQWEAHNLGLVSRFSSPSFPFLLVGSWTLPLTHTHTSRYHNGEDKVRMWHQHRKRSQNKFFFLFSPCRSLSDC